MEGVAERQNGPHIRQQCPGGFEQFFSFLREEGSCGPLPSGPETGFLPGRTRAGSKRIRTPGENGRPSEKGASVSPSSDNLCNRNPYLRAEIHHGGIPGAKVCGSGVQRKNPDRVVSAGTVPDAEGLCEKKTDCLRHGVCDPHREGSGPEQRLAGDEAAGTTGRGAGTENLPPQSQTSFRTGVLQPGKRPEQAGGYPRTLQCKYDENLYKGEREDPCQTD